MLPDHALPALLCLVARDAIDGGQHMEVARRKRCGAFLRSTGAGRRTGQFTSTKHIRTIASAGSHECQQQFFGGLQLQQCRNLETQCRHDCSQYRRRGFSCGKSRTQFKQRTSSSVIHGWSLSAWFSSTRDGVRHYRSRSWRTHVDLGRTRYQGKTNYAQFSCTVLRAATLGITQALAFIAQQLATRAALLMKANRVCVC